MKKNPAKIEKYRGALLGLACGDAVGTSLEFTIPGTFKPIDDMVGGGPFNLKPGQWTDDTSMALCLAESLVSQQGFDPYDQMERYISWYKEGHMSCTGKCFDIGNTVRKALLQFKITGQPYSGCFSPYSAGNGSIMRLAPVPLAYASQPQKAMERSADSSRTTHGTPMAVDACRYLASLMIGALNGVDKEELLSSRFCPLKDYWLVRPLIGEIDEVAAGTFKQRNPPKKTNRIILKLGFQSNDPVIEGSGFVVKSLEAALWAFYTSDTFEEGCLKAANLGNDADTTAAVYGQLAGAYYGEKAIPEKWRNLIAKRPLIEKLAQKLLDLNQKKPD